MAAEKDSHVVILTECEIVPQRMIAELDAAGLSGFTYPFSPAGTSGDIRIFIRFPHSSLQFVHDDANNHVTIRRLLLPRRKRLLLVVVHLQTGRDWGESGQHEGAIRLAQRIIETEKRFSRHETVLVGDLNMNPFEPGVVGAQGLHAVMTRRIAREGHRIVDGENRRFFFNPMWRFFGEREEGPPGTYYYGGSGKPISYFWNMYDQVMVRPGLVDTLKDVKIVHAINGQSLLNDQGHPDSVNGSDHLPLTFSLDL